mmetsp:Transcript_36058/g.95765  ORF Transcript_36058/g.95765 Transcript_36058/m.95765 type:complete len:312 (+) Transcript_36058:2248-3183(+)
MISATIDLEGTKPLPSKISLTYRKKRTTTSSNRRRSSALEIFTAEALNGTASVKCTRSEQTNGNDASNMRPPSLVPLKKRNVVAQKTITHTKYNRTHKIRAPPWSRWKIPTTKPIWTHMSRPLKINCSHVQRMHRELKRIATQVDTFTSTSTKASTALTNATPAQAESQMSRTVSRLFSSSTASNNTPQNKTPSKTPSIPRQENLGGSSHPCSTGELDTWNGCGGVALEETSDSSTDESLSYFGRRFVVPPISSIMSNQASCTLMTCKKPKTSTAKISYRQLVERRVAQTLCRTDPQTVIEVEAQSTASNT